MSKKVLIAVAVLAVLGAAIGLYFVTRPNASAPGSTATNNGSVADEIVYTDNGFQPNVLKVKADTAIRVVNQSSSPLQFSSEDHPTHLKDTELNMGVIQPGGEGSLKVTKTGTHGYHNHLKPNDKGTLEVE